MEDWFRSLSEWAAWGEALVLNGQSPGQCGGMRCPMVRDTCFPKYQATAVETLEQQRAKLGLALLGQLTVISFRLITGHFSGGAVGLLIFVVGNNARCSLQSTMLTSFIALGSVAGTLDVLDLLKEILSYGTGFFALPFEAHLSHNLTAISLLLAPATELGGARAAWDSYLRPSMLFQQAAGSQALDAASAASAPPWYQHPLAAAVGQALYDPAASFSGPAPVLAPLPATPRPSRRHLREDAWHAPSAPPDMRCGRSPMQAMPDYDDQCSECGCPLRQGGCWYGTGFYADKAYCRQCWSEWSGSQPARIG